MFLVFEDRPSDSPFVERVWRARSERAGRMLSVASSHWEMVVARLRGKTVVTFRGPETKVSLLDCPGDGEWLGIRFRLGAFMPCLPVHRLIDGQDIDLTASSGRSFLFQGADWEVPGFENAEVFVARLARRSLLAMEPAVEAVLAGDRRSLSTRTRQRRFLSATGMTHGTFRQIERARYATNLLKRGVSIVDTVHEAGFFDQPHLNRALKHLIGQTPAQIARGEKQLSFLYNTSRRR